jgi:16S rRNA (guanine966-N2)-methyltransferase
MIRITSGKYKNRKIASSLKGNKEVEYRPTSDRTRQAIFNIIANAKFMPDNFLAGAVVADIFCGSGSVGIEALSRGAKLVIFIDKLAEQIKLAKANIEYLNEQANSLFITCDVNFLPLAHHQCNIVYIDPPYGSKLMLTVMDNLVKQKWLAPHNIVVFELGVRDKVILGDKYELLDQREYGRTKLIFCTHRS